MVEARFCECLVVNGSFPLEPGKYSYLGFSGENEGVISPCNDWVSFSWSWCCSILVAFIERV